MIFGELIQVALGLSGVARLMRFITRSVMVGLPRVTPVVPAPLVAIVALTGFTVLAAITVPNVGDESELPDSLPSLFLPNVPLTLETLEIIAPYALAVALVGLIESLLTAKIVDDVTDTPSDETRESWGQGTANVITGFFGGMGGCAMLGQTVINVKVSGLGPGSPPSWPAVFCWFWLSASVTSSPSSRCPRWWR